MRLLDGMVLCEKSCQQYVLSSLSTGADDTMAFLELLLPILIILGMFLLLSFFKISKFVSIDAHGDSKYASSSITEGDSAGPSECSSVKPNKDFALEGFNRHLLDICWTLRKTVGT